MNTLSNEQLNDASGGPIPVIVHCGAAAAARAIAGAIDGYMAGNHQTTSVDALRACVSRAPSRRAVLGRAALGANLRRLRS